MKTQEIANRLILLCRKGAYLQAYQELYDEHAVSKEMNAVFNDVTEGKNNIIREYLKSKDNIVEIHHQYISDPLVADHFFVVKMASDITFADIGRQEMEELCLYKVENGKVAEALFFYAPIQPLNGFFVDYKNKKPLEEELFV
ncbi:MULTISPECIES: SnoaL-like domain-containing protein [Galbibacter]|uniref:SnoaL-like domain-containing protein n=1 Tax=Galbibacter pacificus TaxID=2996052 RepID=A0ABT6FUQ5_9FLAO|nr:SnoaL-like domain-containing protein [Galbibacter pacificus]MDG3583524.1 hypothetical protein [Galbibacter pacificus]MDG3587000.1 hypothetical protein [Galbibacter pacificus]